MTRPALAFDCDGVLLDTNPMKIDAFVATLTDYPGDVVAEFSAYQQKSFGRSRYRLFEDFFRDFLGRPAAADELETCLTAYGEICSAGYLSAPMTQGCLPFIQRMASTHDLYVVSGSDQTELREVFRARGLSQYFVEIFGSPIAKADNLKTVTKRTNGRCALFFGDAKADFEAATACAMPFVFVRDYSAAPDQMLALAAEQAFPVLPNLSHISVDATGSPLIQQQ